MERSFGMTCLRLGELSVGRRVLSCGRSVLRDAFKRRYEQQGVAVFTSDILQVFCRTGEGTRVFSENRVWLPRQRFCDISDASSGFSCIVEGDGILVVGGS